MAQPKVIKFAEISVVPRGSGVETKRSSSNRPALNRSCETVEHLSESDKGGVRQ